MLTATEGSRCLRVTEVLIMSPTSEGSTFASESARAAASVAASTKVMLESHCRRSITPATRCRSPFGRRSRRSDALRRSSISSEVTTTGAVVVVTESRDVFPCRNVALPPIVCSALALVLIRPDAMPGRLRSSWTSPEWRCPLDGDDLRRAEFAGHVLREARGLLDQRRHDLRLGHGLDDLALDEDLALAVAGCDTQVGLASFTRSVHDAAHDRDAQRHRHVLEPLRHLIRERVDVDLGAAAARAGDDLELALAQVERLQDLQADLDLLDGRGAERDTNRVADALREQDAEGGRRLDRALEGGTGLHDAEVERPVAALGKKPVGLDHDDRVIVLDRDLEVVEVVLLEEARLPHGALHERLRGGLAVLLQQARVERTGVDADADAHAG